MCGVLLPAQCSWHNVPEDWIVLVKAVVLTHWAGQPGDPHAVVTGPSRAMVNGRQSEVGHFSLGHLTPQGLIVDCKMLHLAQVMPISSCVPNAYSCRL